MKFLSILLFLIFAVYAPLSAQTWSGDYLLNTQTEVDNFPKNCNCTHIDGNLTIDDGIMQNLDSLYRLKVVTGNVQITETVNLTSIQLANLDSIGENLTIRNNSKIQSLEGLNQLKFIGANFNLSRNTGLTSLKGLDSLKHVGGEFLIFSNWNLLNIEGPSVLMSAGKLRLINGTSGNADYLLTGFNGLRKVGDLEIFLPGNAGRIHGFDSLEVVEGNLKLDKNYQLYELEAFQGLKTIGNDLILTELHSLEELDAFHALQEVGGTINLSACRNLELIQGFTGLQTVGSILIRTHSKLQRIDGFEALQRIQGELAIHTNAQLISIPSFSALSFIAGAFGFWSNSMIDTLDIMPELQEVDDLAVRSNQSLKALLGLSNLKQVKGKLEIVSNDSLQSIEGLRGLESIRRLTVSQNQQLNNCCLLKCFIENEIIEGFTQISLNGNGCNSVDEILTVDCEENCEGISTALDTGESPDFLVFPNPTHGLIILNIPKTETRNFLIHILDAKGNKLQSFISEQNLSQISLQKYGSGIYFVLIQNMFDPWISDIKQVVVY